MRNFLIVIVAIILIAAVACGFIFRDRLKQYKAELASIQSRIEVVTGQITQAEEKITQLEQENLSLGQKISESKNKITNYNNQVSEFKNKKEQTRAKLQDERAQLASLDEELKNLISEKEALTLKLNELTLNKQSATDEINSLSDAKRQIEEEIKKYLKPGEGVELDKIVVKLSQVPDGSIGEVNQKYGFAVINIGREAGLIVGDILGVYRNNELVSKVIVEKTFKDFSSVVPSEGYTDVELKVSDKVSLIK